MKKLTLLAILALLALVLAACGGEYRVNGVTTFQEDGMVLAHKDAEVECIKECTDGDLKLADGQKAKVVSDNGAMLDLSNGKVITGTLEWGAPPAVPTPDPATAAATPDPNAAQPATAQPPAATTKLQVYVTEKAKNSNDWRQIEPTIGPDAEVIVVASSSDVPPWSGVKRVWFNRWDKDPTYLFYRDKMSFLDFQALGDSDDFAIWHE